MIIYVLSIILILISIFISIVSPTLVKPVPDSIMHYISKKVRSIFTGEEVKNTSPTEIPSPFQFTGLSALFAIAIHAILLIRNKRIREQFKDIKLIVLYLLDLIFLLTLFSLIPSDTEVLFWKINCKVLLAFAVILTMTSVSLIYPYVWMVTGLLLISQLKAIDDYSTYSIIYFICGYTSIIFQILIFNLFIDYGDKKIIFKKSRKRKYYKNSQNKEEKKQIKIFNKNENVYYSTGSDSNNEGYINQEGYRLIINENNNRE